MGLTLEVVPSDADESAITAKSPARLTRLLSRLKAESVDGSGATVIGADTVVALGGRIYGKPHTEERAIEMLSEMQGRWHSVYTGVTVACVGRSVTFSVRSRVKFKPLTDGEILSYVKQTNPLDKAGAYGIQDGRVVEKYRGSYSNIVGLPKEKLAKVLARLGVINGNC